MKTSVASWPDLNFGVILKHELHILMPEHILMIEQALAEVGPDGEISLIVENGQLHSIEKLPTTTLKADARDRTR